MEELGIVDFFDKGALLAYIITFILSFILIIYKLFHILYLWQIKEYRFDRYLSHIKTNGVTIKNIIIICIKIAPILFVIFELLLPEVVMTLIVVVGVGSLINLIVSLQSKKAKKPKLKSLRNIIILFISLVLSVVWILWDLGVMIFFPSYLYSSAGILTYTIFESVATVIYFWLYVDIFLELIIAVLVILTSPIAWLKRTRIKKQGQATLALARNIKTIGITGSYGKTTTKELLYQVLSKKYKVAKTPEHYNTAVGIALAIKEQVKVDTEIFIAEMGAYKIGEIKEATDIVPLDIAIVTGIEGQHLSLFGSMKNLVNTKFEIIQGLKDEKGVAILNGDNEYCIQMAGRTNHKKILYFSIDEKNKIASGTSEEELTEAEEDKMYKFPHDTNIYATKVQAKSNGISFELSFSGATYDVSTNVIGVHNVLNLMAVISTCVTLGMEVEEVVKIINTTEFSFPYLNSSKALNDSILIDDGYNISHKGFVAGLAYLKLFKSDGRKWVMTQGLIELGVEKEMVYDNIAKEIVAVADGLMTNDRDLIGAIKKSKNDFKTIEILNVKEVDKLYSENVNVGDVVLLEGAFPEGMVKKIIN